MLASDSSESLRFLMDLYPSGPWMLTAISVDKKTIRAQTFMDPDGIVPWLEEHDQFNLYYSVNEPTTTTEAARSKTKLSKTDVASVHFLHVDVDPREGENVAAEQKRILAQLIGYKIKPTFIVFSGGGYNALWRLDEAVPVASGSSTDDETLTRAVDVERRNWQFEIDFDTPDHCRDVSRILRLPGTINRPDAKKVAKGRVPALSYVVSSSAAVYPLSSFMATPVVATNAGKSKTKVAENIVRLESLDNLGVPDRLKIIIAQGFDPDPPAESKGKTKSRSEWLYFACCELVRNGVKDEEILGIITDSRFLISASVLDKGNGMMRYALRQVQRARDNADHPLLAEMNDRYAVILSYGNQTVVMVENARLNEATKQYEPVFQTFRSFKDRIKRYPSIKIELPSGKEKNTSAFEWWTGHPRRREFQDVTFEPGLDTPDRYNFWTGFATQAVSGDHHKRYLDHMFENICAADQRNYDYLIKWMARVVQTPRTSSMVVPVLLGERGTGKSVYADYFGALFEPHRYTVSDIQELTGKFNAHLGSCVYVVAEEAFDLRDKRHESVLKERITGRTISIERKGLDKIQMPNYIHLIMTSNNERVVPAGDHERRFFVLRVGDKRRQDSDYFKKILEDQRNGGVANLLYHLMSLDLTDYDVTAFPRTSELREQQEHNLALEIKWLLDKLDSGMWFPDGAVRWEGPVRKKMLHDDYKSYMFGLNTKMVKGERAFHKFIMRELPGTIDQQIYGKGPHDRPMAFIFPLLEKCREAFDRNRGWRENWRPIQMGRPIDPEETDVSVEHPVEVF